MMFGINVNSPQAVEFPRGNRPFVPNHLQLWVYRMRQEIERDTGRPVSVMMEWSRRAGKTALAAYLGRRSVIERGENFVMFAADDKTAQDNWREVEAMFDDIAMRKNMVSKGEIEIPSPDDGGRSSFVRLVMAGGKQNSGRGAVGRCVLFDEAQLMSGATFSRMAPAIMASRGQYYATYTPPATPTQIMQSQWLYDDMAKVDWQEGELCRWGFKGGDKSVLYTHAPIKPFMLAHKFYREDVEAYGVENIKPWDWYLTYAEERIDALRGEMNAREPLSFERECLLRTESAPGQYAYRDIVDLHITADAEYDPDGGPVFWSVDRGEGDALTVVLLFQIRDGNQIAVFDQYITKSLSSEMDILVDVARASDGYTPEIVMRDGSFDRRLPYKRPLWATGDVRAPRMIDALRHVTGDVHKRSVSAWLGYKVTRAAFNEGKLKIHPRCSELITELRLWAYDSTTQSFGAKNNDAAQCLQYGVVQAARLLKWDAGQDYPSFVQQTTAIKMPILMVGI